MIHANKIDSLVVQSSYSAFKCNERESEVHCIFDPSSATLSALPSVNRKLCNDAKTRIRNTYFLCLCYDRPTLFDYYSIISKASSIQRQSTMHVLLQVLFYRNLALPDAQIASIRFQFIYLLPHIVVIFMTLDSRILGFGEPVV